MNSLQRNSLKMTLIKLRHCPGLPLLTMAILLLLTCGVRATYAQDTHASPVQLPLRLDCGPAGQQLAPGFQPWTGKDLYNPKRGYGWVKPWGFETASSSHDDPRFADSITAREHIDTQPTENNVTFRVDLPNGVYAVTVWVGDPSPTEGRRGICAAINGRVVLAPPGVGGWGMITERVLPAVVDQGVLNLNLFIDGQGGAARLALLAMSVERAADPAHAQVLRKQWDAAASANAPQRELRVGDQVLKEVGRQREPEAAKLPANWPVRDYLTFTRPSPGEMLAYSVPTGAQITQQISGFASPGEDHPMWFAVHALRDLKDVRISCSDLQSDSGRIAAHEVQLFTLTTRPRTLSDRPGQVAKLMADLLEQDFPFDLEAGSSQPIYLRLHVPPATPAGSYSGKLTITPRDAQPMQMKVNLRVLPIQLQQPTGKVWHLFSDTARWNSMSDIARRDEINDMARHGINSLTVGYPPTGAAYIERDGRIVDADYGVVSKGLREAKQAGMTGPIFIASTAGVVFRLHGWSIGHRGNAQHQFIDIDAGKAITIEHADNTAQTELGGVSGSILQPGDSVRLEVRYRTQGKITASASLGFMKTYKRNPVADGRVTGTLDATDDWRTFTAVTHVPEHAIYGMAKFHIAGGPGKLIIDHVRILGPDGVINHQVNGDFNRTFETVSNDQDPWPSAFANHYVDALKALGKAVERAGFEPWIEGTDEAGNNPKSAAREINELRWAKATGYPTWCNLSPHLAEQVTDVLDGVCHYVNFLGGPDGSAALLKRAHDRGQKLYVISSGCYVGQEADLLPNRHGVGLFFWKTGADGTAIWTYQRTNGDPFNDFDGQFKDYCLVFPPRKPGGKPVPTLGWEGVREGWRDYLYVHTLEQAVEHARSEGRTSDAAVGQVALQFIRHAVPWYDQIDNAGYDNAAADRLRWLAAWAIMHVNGDAIAGTNTTTAPADNLVQINPANAETDDAAPMLMAPAVTAPPVFDGRLDDAVWNDAAAIDGFEIHAVETAGDPEKTQVRLVHDDAYLYLGVRCYESNMPGLRTEATQRDGNVFADDSVEIFLDTSHDHFNFYQLAFNAAGVQFDMKCAGANDFGQSVYGAAYDRKKIRDQAWTGDWQVKTSRHADRWEAEVRIPFAVFGRASDLWGIHVGRNRHAGPKQTTANRAIGMFHQPARFTHLLLTGSRISQQRIASLDIPSPYWGRSQAVIRWTGSDRVTSSTAVIAHDGSSTTFAGNSDSHSTTLAYTLDASAGMVQWQLRNSGGQTAWQIQLPVDVPEAIELRNGRWVRFVGENALRFDLAIKLAQQKRDALKLHVAVLDAQGKVLSEAVQPASQENYHATLNLTQYPPQLYRLAISLVDEQGKAVLAAEQPVMVVPHFTQD